MASGTISMSSSGIGAGRISWSSTANKGTNKSSVSATLQFRFTSGVKAGEKYTINYFISAATSSESRLGYKEGSTVVTVPSTTTSWITVASTSFTASHASNGSCTLSFSAAESMKSGAGGASLSSASVTLDKIPAAAYLTAADNFTDVTNPTIKYYNEGGSSTNLRACISLTGAAADVPYRDLTRTGTSYTFTLTDAERQTLINAVTSGNSRSVKFYLKCELGGYTKTSILTRTFTLTDYTPTMTPAAVDMNPTTNELTGDVNKFIKGYSTAACQFHATGRKNATISSYKIVNGSQTVERTADVMSISNVDSGSFVFTVTDSRGNSTTQTVTKSFIDYFKPTCRQEAEIKLSGETTATVSLTIKGDFFNGSFGAVKNTPVVQFRHKTGNGSYTAWTNVSDVIWETTTKNNTYTVKGNISGIPYDEAFTIQSRVSDSLETTTTTEYKLKLIPVFDWSETDFQFNVPVTIKGDLTVEGSLEVGGEGTTGPVDYIIEQGTEAMGSNGTWYWEKWKNGKAVCYGTRNFGNMSISSAWGSLYEQGPFSQTFPSGLFKNKPDMVNMSIQQTSGGAMIETASTSDFSATQAPKFYIVRGTSTTLSAVHVSFHAIGKWK